MPSTVFLIPCHLYDQVTNCIPAYVWDAVTACDVLMVENERTARRYLKMLNRQVVIDHFTWVNIQKIDTNTLHAFDEAIRQEKNIGIMSEAGCPGVADPGQQLVQRAHRKGVQVKPLVGPSSILLALMGAGFNGQQFCFTGYLPVDGGALKKKLKQIEQEVIATGRTEIFIETPYRNEKLLQEMLNTLDGETNLCIATDLTAPSEYIQSKKIKEWKSASIPLLHKRPAIFLIGIVG